VKLIEYLLAVINGYKTYASVILAIISGLGLILTSDYGGSISELLQALTLVFGGTSIAALRHAVAKLSSSREVGLRHAVGDDPGPNGTIAGEG
jgi:hypothetical protein